LMSGYRASLPVAEFTSNGQAEFAIVAKRQSEVAFRCLVVKQLTNATEATNANPPNSANGVQSPHTLAGPFSTNDGVLYI